MPIFHRKAEPDRSRSTRSSVRNSDCSVKNINKFMDRRRRLHLRQPGGNLNSGMNDSKNNGKMSNGGKSGKYSRSEPLTFFCMILAYL